MLHRTRHHFTMAGWMLAVLLTLPLAGCAEDAPAASMTEAEPETFDAATVYAATVYEIVPVGGTPTQPDDSEWRYAYFVQFENEEAKRVFSKAVNSPDGLGPPMHLAPLSAEHTAQAWSDERTVLVVGNAPLGGWKLIHSYNWDPPDFETLYGTDRKRRPLYGTDRNRREEVRR